MPNNWKNKVSGVYGNDPWMTNQFSRFSNNSNNRHAGKVNQAEGNTYNANYERKMFPQAAHIPDQNADYTQLRNKLDAESEM